LVQWIQDEFPAKESFILIKCVSFCIEGFAEENEDCEVLYNTEIPSAQNENYTIYRVWMK